MLSEGDTIKGLIGATVGLILGCVGFDPIDGSPRFAFGSTYLTAGIPLIPAMIGLYGFTEVFSGLTDVSVKSFPLTVVLDLFKQARNEVEGTRESGFFGQKGHLVIIFGQVEVDPGQDVFAAFGMAINGLMEMPKYGKVHGL
jgi:hypothetical protein